MKETLLSTYRKKRWSFFWKNFQVPIINLNSVAPNAELIKPVIFDHLCLPPYHGPQDHDDITPLLSLVNYYHPNTILEIGTAHGATVANICAVSNATVFTVNALPEQLEGNITTFCLTKDEIGWVYRKYGYQDRVGQIYENTWKLDITRYFLGDKKIDFVIIDGCHDSEFVINDFLCILPVINSNSVVLFHDIGLGNSDPLTSHLDDGYIACMYLRKLGYNIQLLQGTWWGIWNAKNPRIHQKFGTFLVNEIVNLVKPNNRSIFNEVRLFRLYQERFRE